MRLASTILVMTLGFALDLACHNDGDSSSSSASSTGSTTQASETAATTTPTTGDPGDALQRCRPTCMADADCNIDGQDIGYRCVTGICRPPPCSDDAACVATLGGWTEPCANQLACPEGKVCIAVAGEGRCAITPSIDLQCIDLGLDELTQPTIEGDKNVTVCGVTMASCVAGECRAPCTSDAACPAQLGHPSCEPSTGECICTADSDCQNTMKPGLIVCIAGRCGCSSDMDCTGGTNVDTCYAGACGCASTATCSTQIYNNATQICGPA